MIVVSDATPLNVFVRIGQVEVLPRLFGTVVIPPAVEDELSRPATPADVRAWVATRPPWLQVRIPTGTDDPSLPRHRGEREAIQLIFAQGFSTAERVTEVSGRGVGLDVVLKAIERLNGLVEVESLPGVGTKFIIQLPLTLAIISTLLVRVSGFSAYFVDLDRVCQDEIIARTEQVAI